jgi:DNA-binding beta-propeller fold protein YncE
VYVVDTLNGRVVKLSPEGDFLAQFGELGDTAGALARPKGVAVDDAGRVFVSDGLRAALEVFGADGEYLGMIGRRTPEDASSGSIFQAPAGLRIAEDTLYVTDRMSGLVILALAEPAAVPIAPAPE